MVSRNTKRLSGGHGDEEFLKEETYRHRSYYIDILRIRKTSGNWRHFRFPCEISMYINHFFFFTERRYVHSVADIDNYSPLHPFMRILQERTNLGE